MGIKRKYKRRSVIKNLYRRAWISIMSTFLTISMFAGSTYAWFASNAFTKGNLMKSGVMAVDLVMSEEELQEAGKDTEDYIPYIRYIDTTDDGDYNPEEYYVITDTDTAVITIENAEPGQIYPVKLKLVNTGQLALQYTALFEIEESDTGLERLNKEKEKTIEYLKSHHLSFTSDEMPIKNYEYDQELTNEGLLTIREYEIRKRVLEREQIDYDSNSETYNTDIGGHLEEVLSVYIGTNAEDVKFTNRLGTIENLIENSNERFCGYLLPYTEIASYLPSGKTVTIIDKSGEEIIRENVTEYGELDLLIKLPENTENIYQYSSLTLRVGIRARQVEYEEDGLGIRIYDASIGQSDEA